MSGLQGRARVPRVLAVCAEADAPWRAVLRHGGTARARRTQEQPRPSGTPTARRRLGYHLVDALAELHAVDIETAGLADFGRPAPPSSAS